jgi:type II secretory pathway component PulC
VSRAASNPKEWALAIGGGLALAIVLVLLLRGGGDDAPTSLAAATSPAVVSTVPPPAAAPAPPPPADLALVGLRAGPDGGMAIVISGGRQILLRPGRSLPGGLVLRRVEPGRAVFSGPAGEMALAFPDSAVPRQAAPAGPPGGDPTPWRLALSPVRSNGVISGWRLDSTAGLPMLARAGLLPGDVLLAANGAALISEEKIIELPQELASNGQLALTIRRGTTERAITAKP